MGGAYPCYGCALNSLIRYNNRADEKIRGVGIMRTIGTDHKTENYICFLNNGGYRGNVW